MNLKDVRQESQAQKTHIVRSHSYEMSIVGKSKETENNLVLIRAWGEGEIGSEYLIEQGFSLG